MRALAFLLVISLGVKAQRSDSLLPEILSVKSDTERVNRLYKRGFGLRTNDPQLAFEYATLCEKEALKCRSEKHLAKSYNLLGVLYYRKGDYRTSLSYHRRALELRIACGDTLSMAFSHTNLGNVYSDLKLYGQAEDSYLKAMETYRRLNNTEKIIASLINIGTIKHRLKQFDTAVENYKMAMELAGSNDYDAKAMCLTNLGEAYVEKHELDKAIACNEDALKLRMLSDNRVEAADNYLNLGGIYTAMDEPAKAKQLIDTAYFIAARYNYFELIYEASKVYSLYYSAIKNHEEAFKWLWRYNTLSDSINALQSSERLQYDFNDTKYAERVTAAAKPVGNIWLLAGVTLSLIIVPLYLIRFKR